MIFSSFNQLNNILIFIFLGIILGLIYCLIEIIFLLNLQKKLKNITINSVFYIFFALFFVFLINIFNFGIFSISLLLALILGFIWIKTLCKKLVVFLKNKWYNIFKTKRKRNEKQTKKC